MNQSLNSNPTSVLETAWQRYAELDANASAASKQYLRLRGWVISLGVLATLIAVLTNYNTFWGPTVGQILTVALITVPITSAVILAFANKFQQGGRWLVLRTGAEEIKKEIYLYRTILQKQEDRDQWLNERVSAIQRQVLEGLGGDLVLKPYSGPVPPYYTPTDDTSDPGFADLLANEYILYRLDDQLDYHSKRILDLEKSRTRLQIAIFAFGGLGTILAAAANMTGYSSLSVWVALTSSLAAAFTAWLELRQVDAVINNYSHLILELKIIRDHWSSLSKEERTGNEFFKLVTAAEKVLWSQHNQYISQMRQAVADMQNKDGDKVSQVMNMPAHPALDEALLRQVEASILSAGIDWAKVEAGAKQVVKKVVAATTAEASETGAPPEKVMTVAAEKARLDDSVVEQVTATETTPAESKVRQTTIVTQTKPHSHNHHPKRKIGLPHVFVVMPFGRKQGADGRWLDFNSIYGDLIKPAMEEAGFEPFRADEENVSGDILTDMFQELLLADLVVADLSIDNANVFYELGVRHALRKRGLIHIQSGRAYLPFDIFNVRTIPYHTDKNGRPDPQYLDKDKQAIIKVARETYASNQERIHSPIFNLLDGLQEPNRKSLHTPLATGYWREHYEWQERVTIAQRQGRIGDVLLLTEEVSNPLIKEDAIAEAGQALKNLGHHELALQQYREGLKINSKNVLFRREEAFHLARLRQYEEAIVKLERLLEDEPTHIEAIPYLGRIYKEMWLHKWEEIQEDQERRKKAYETAYWLKKAIHSYLTGYRLDQNFYYSGINALILSTVLDDLASTASDQDMETVAVRQELASLKGAVQFNLNSQIQKNSNDFWAYLSLGDLAVCTAAEPKTVKEAYQKALPLAGQNKYALEITLEQLELLQSLGVRLQFVEAGIAVLGEEIGEAQPDEPAPAEQTSLRLPHVFLFSGHMIDSKSRPEPRFPPSMESEVRQRIEQALDKLAADAQDMAITAGAACGGDILFIEACLQRQMRVEVFMPFEEAKFIEESVSFAGDEWVERFYAIRNHPNVTFSFQADRLGPVPEGVNPYERNNLWALYSTLCYGIDQVRLIALWDGKGGDGPGGTGHMVQEVRRLGGIAEHLDTTKFDYWKAKGKVSQVLDSLIQSR